MNDAAIEREIQDKGLNAPRVAPIDIESNISSEYYFTAANTVDGVVTGYKYPGTLDMITTCVMILKNGHRIVGVNTGPVSPENFDAELGKKLARKNAVDQIWPLMGYALREKLYQESQLPCSGPVIEKIARVCHEVNRAYCAALGDNSQPVWEEAPGWQRESARMGVDLHLMGDFGPEASHISWMKQKLAEGWVYGPVKDPQLKTHPCIVPFDALPREQQAKDFIFRAVVHALKD